MKKAIGYIRISTKDQSNFSLSGQEKYVREYAERLNITVSAIFEDDGKSAKNFDRPDWKKLEEFIHEHYRDVDYLIVAKYDRFSRNAAQGLQKIELLERRYRIIIVSVFEQMFIDYDSPFFFKQRADMLVAAEFELHVIRDRTKFGIHQALASGRFINKAPFGYKNIRDSKNKPALIIDENKAAVIKKIFQMYMDGHNIIDIFREARRSGLTMSSNSVIPRILSNCVYAGLIYMPEYRKEAAQYIKGIHEPIIDEHTWWEIQQRTGSAKLPKNIANNDVPLRGLLKCHCHKNFTAGNSKGKNKYYWYYKCNDHPKINLPATKLHNQFDEVLKHLSLADLHIECLHRMAEEEMQLQLKDKDKNLESLRRELQATEANIDNLEKKFIEGDLASSTYKKWYSKYANAASAARHQLGQLEKDSNDQWNLFYSQLVKLGDVHYLYHQADLLHKRTFIRQVFNSQLSYVEGIYRTPYLLPLLSHNTLILKQKRLLVVEQPPRLAKEMITSTRDGS